MIPPTGSIPRLLDRLKKWDHYGVVVVEDGTTLWNLPREAPLRGGLHMVCRGYSDAEFRRCVEEFEGIDNYAFAELLHDTCSCKLFCGMLDIYCPRVSTFPKIDMNVPDMNDVNASFPGYYDTFGGIIFGGSRNDRASYFFVERKLGEVLCVDRKSNAVQKEWPDFSRFWFAAINELNEGWVDSSEYCPSWQRA